MIRSTLALTALTATPALAHDGAHLHPHGAGPVLMGLVLIVLALGLVALRRR